MDALFDLILGWTLCFIGIGFSFRSPLQSPENPAPRIWQTIRRFSSPLGSILLGARVLLIHYGVLASQDVAARNMLLIASLGIAGGIVANRISWRSDEG